MTSTEEEEPHGVHYTIFEGWPGTVSMDRMATAYKYWQNNQEHPSEDTQAGRDANYLYLALATNLYHTTLDTELATLPTHDTNEYMDALTKIALDAETDHTFGGLIFLPTEGLPDFEQLQQIPVLVRDPEWMGACTALPLLKGCELQVFESYTRANQPSYFIARTPPNDGMPPTDDAPFPPGQPELLRDIALWHGAVAWYWIPNQDGNDNPQGDPVPTLAVALT